MRPVGPLGRRVAAAVVVLVVLAVGVVAADRSRRLVDLTEDRSLTLSAVTRDVVAAVDRRVDVTVVIGRDEPGRVEAVALLDRYRRLNRRIRPHVVDPADSPGEVRRLGVDPATGGVAVQAGDRLQLAAGATEQDVTSALARLLRRRDVVVCPTTGHGETEIDVSLLEAAGYVVRPADLLARPEVPPACEAVVVAGPRQPLGPALAALGRWLAADGKALVLADPASDVDLSPLLAPYGLGIRRGVVLEGDPDSVVAGDELSPIVRRYSSAHPVVRRLPPTYFPGVQEVTVDDDLRVPGLTVNRLADTSDLSYLETEPLEPSFDPARDVGGPITVAAAADRSRLEGEAVHRTRVVVVGDVDVATPAFTGAAANGRLLLQATGWLTLDEELIPLSANVPADRPLRLTDGRRQYALVLSAGIVPALFLVGGGLVWAVRRSR